jgi:hypothetical protein
VVKCIDCGFLTLRNKHTGQLDEVDNDFRETGNPPRRQIYKQVASNTVNRIETPCQHVPICFECVTDFRREIGVPPPKAYGDYPANMVLEVISEPRSCDSFAVWQQGFTPKEHREMLDRQHHLEWQTEQEKERRNWESGQRWILAIIAGAFGILGAIVGALLNAWLG